MHNFPQVNTPILTTYFIPLALILLATIYLFYINQRKIRLMWMDFKTRYCLNNLGLEQLANLNCPDGLGQHFNIDRLVLRHDGISLLVYKKYPGKIFCADNIDDWTQMLGRRSYRFKNPLYELDYQIKAVSACMPDIPVNGFIFFDHLSEFPKGHPERIIHPDRIPEELRRFNRHQVEVPVMSAWKNIQALAQES